MTSERLDELAARYACSGLDAEETRELEELLARDEQARERFAQYCMDEMLLREAVTSASVPQPRLSVAQPSFRARRWASAAALLLTFATGWGLSTWVSPADLLPQRSRETPTDLIPLYYPPASAEPDGLPVVYALDFDESGNLSTNPFLRIQPVETTEL